MSENLEEKAAVAFQLLREASEALGEELGDKSLEMNYDGGLVDGGDDTSTDSSDESDVLSIRQQAQAAAQGLIVDNFGQYDQSAGEDGAHYMVGDDNPFAHGGIMCSNCVFYDGDSPDDQGWGACQIVSGSIDPDGLCKLWVIPENSIEGEEADDDETADSADTADASY